MIGKFNSSYCIVCGKSIRDGYKFCSPHSNEFIVMKRGNLRRKFNEDQLIKILRLKLKLKKECNYDRSKNITINYMIIQGLLTESGDVIGDKL